MLQQQAKHKVKHYIVLHIKLDTNINILGNVVSILPQAHCIRLQRKVFGKKANDEIYRHSENTMV